MMFRHVQTKYKLKMSYPKLSDVLQNKDDCQYFRRSFLHVFNYTLQIFSRQIQGRFTLYGPWSNLKIDKGEGDGIESRLP